LPGFNIYAWLAENEPEASPVEKQAASGQSFEETPALGDELWKALAPSNTSAETAFDGTGARVETRWVATDPATGASPCNSLVNEYCIQPDPYRQPV